MAYSRRPVDPGRAPRTAERPEAPPTEAKLDDLRQRLNELLARSGEPAQPAPSAAIDSTLRGIESRIDQARARYRIQRAELFPTVDASGNVRVTHSNGTASTSSNAGGVVVGSGGGTNTSYSVDLGITAFEIDLFGRVRSLTHSALDQYFSTEASTSRS